MNKIRKNTNANPDKNSQQKGSDISKLRGQPGETIRPCHTHKLNNQNRYN